MHVEPLVAALQATLRGQGELAGGEPAVDAAVGQLVELLGPALRQVAFDLAEQAAAEVRAQLPDRTVDVVLVDGDPTLRVTEAPPPDPAGPDEELDARITLRLTPSLKKAIEDVAVTAGESVNGWVVDQLSRRTGRARARAGFRTTTTFEM